MTSTSSKKAAQAEALKSLNEVSTLLEKARDIYTQAIEDPETSDKALMEIEMAIIQGTNIKLEKYLSYHQSKRACLKTNSNPKRGLL